jgi:hypothetical protein
MLGQAMQSTPPDTEELQRSNRREKVLRARSMTEAERLAATLDQIDLAFEWMLEGVKQQSVGINDDDALRILAERLDRQHLREDRHLFVPAPAAA